MFRRKARLVKVEVTLRHGGSDCPDRCDSIDILPGQSFEVDIVSCVIKEHGRKVREIDYRAGYTQDFTYYYQ